MVGFLVGDGTMDTNSKVFQVVIFVKSVQRCMALAQLLIEQNFPAIAIHRGMTQEERLSRYQQFKDFQKVNQAHPAFTFDETLVISAAYSGGNQPVWARYGH